MASPVCRSSRLPYSAHDEDVLRLLAMPVTDQIIHHVAHRLAAALSTPGNRHLPTPPVTPIRGKFTPNNPTYAPELDFPPLEEFITLLVLHSKVHTASVLCSLIYLGRITKALQVDSIKHGPETPYRLVVALFVISSKYNHDSSPPTVRWAVCVAMALGIDPSDSKMACKAYEARRASRRPKSEKKKSSEAENELDVASGFSELTPIGYMFGAQAITALERDLLHLLNFNLGLTEDQLRDCMLALNSHPRAPGPLTKLTIGMGRPSVEFSRWMLTPTTRRTIPPPNFATHSELCHAPLTPSSIPHTPITPLRLPRPVMEKSKDGRGLENGSAYDSRFCVPYPQLNTDIDMSYLSERIARSRCRNPFHLLGTPSGPPSTPVAGVNSLPFIYGGKACHGPAPLGVTVPPGEDSPWTQGQVGEILRRTMEHQAKQLVAAATNPARKLKLLDTPPPVSIFGSGTLYLHDSNRSSVEPETLSKPSTWGITIGEPRSRAAIKEDVEKWTRARIERHDGMPSTENQPVFLSSKREFCLDFPAPHYRAVIESGPADLLNTRWNSLQAWLVAHEEDQAEEEFQTTMPLRIVDKRTPRKHNSGTANGTLSPVPSMHDLPLECSQTSMSWLGRIFGKKVRQEGDTVGSV